MRRFEHRDGKFWAVARANRAIEIRWGKVGTHGQSRRIHFDTDTDAAAKYDELVDTQLELGYVEVADAKAIVGLFSHSGHPVLLRFEHADGRYVEMLLEGKFVQTCSGARGEDEQLQRFDYDDWGDARDRAHAIVYDLAGRGFLLAAAPPKPANVQRARDPQLEAQCLAAGDDRAQWLVYADWLMLHGDVRGELAALYANDQQLKAETLFRDHRTILFGSELAATVTAIATWRHGFAQAASLAIPWQDRETADLVAGATAFFASPLAETIEHLKLNLYESDKLAPILDALVASPIVEHVRALHVTGVGQTLDPARRWPQLALDELHLYGALLAVPSLVRLGCGVRDLDEVCRETWPRLVRLQVEFEYDAPDTMISGIERLSATESMPELRELVLAGASIDATIRVLATSAVLQRVRRVTVSGRVLARTTRTLLSRADAFEHLEELRLDGLLGQPDVQAKLRARLPNLVIGSALR